MKKNWRNGFIASVGFIFLMAGCQTTQMKETSREPAFARHRSQPQPDPGNGQSDPSNTPPPNVDQPDPVVAQPGPGQDPVTPVTPPVVVAPPVTPVTNDPPAQLLRITAINGVYNTDHGPSVNVHPGDLVTLSADVFDENDQLTAENRAIDELKWSANDTTNIFGTDSDVCNASDASDCLSDSKFQVNDYGVSFYVPYNIQQNIKITVSDGVTPGAGNDAIILTNVDYVSNYVPPTQVCTAPEQYTSGAFNADTALAGQGVWVSMDGARYFVPYKTEADWEPYNHGYWGWETNDGWTWNSYDKWGWYTDHYGTWRHHGQYGWIWSPYDDFQYRASGVTWFYDGGHVGWYPYNSAYSRGYVWRAEHGFDDGYWGGYHDADYWGRGSYHPGFYHVRNEDFGRDDVWGHRANDIDVFDMYRGSYGRKAYGAWPGGRDRDTSYGYMHTRVTVTSCQVEEHNYGSDHMRFPVAGHAVPEQYRGNPDNNQRFGNHPIAVGSVVGHDGGGHEHYVPPTNNGRGISAPPVYHDPRNGVVNLPPRTNHPAEPNHDNPGYHQAPHNGQGPVLPPVVNHGGNHGGDNNNHGGGNNGGNHGGNNPGEPVTPPSNGGGNNGGNNGHGGNGGNHGGNNPTQPVVPPATPPSNGGGNTGGNNGGNNGHGGNGGHGGNTPVTPVEPVTPPNAGGGSSSAGGANHGGGHGGNTPVEPGTPPSNGGGNNGGGRPNPGNGGGNVVRPEPVRPTPGGGGGSHNGPRHKDSEDSDDQE